MVWELAPLLPRQEFCHRVLDPQQLVGWLRQKRGNLVKVCNLSTCTHEFSSVRTHDSGYSPVRAHEFCVS